MGDVEGIAAEPVTRWFQDNVDGVEPPLTFALVAGGRSNLTYRVDDARRASWVLRRPPLGHILPTAHDPEAGDLLARRLTDVLDEARERYDLVLIDTPPLLSTDDARTIATLAKGILLVVTRGTLARSVTESVVAIEALQAPLMGIVANRFKEASVPYYY